MILLSETYLPGIFSWCIYPQTFFLAASAPAFVLVFISSFIYLERSSMTWTSWDVGSIHQSFSTIQGIWISVLVIFSHVAQSHMTSQEVLFPFFFRFNLQIPSWDVRQRFLHLFHLKAWVWLAAVQILVRSLGEKVCAVVLAAPGLISWVGWSTTPGWSYLRN